MKLESGALWFQSPLSLVLLGALSLTLALPVSSKSTVIGCGCAIVGLCMGGCPVYDALRCSLEEEESWMNREQDEAPPSCSLYFQINHRRCVEGGSPPKRGWVLSDRTWRAATVQCSGLPKVGRKSDLLFTVIQSLFSCKLKEKPRGFLLPELWSSFIQSYPVFRNTLRSPAYWFKDGGQLV